jgi:hypothetical protein
LLIAARLDCGASSMIAIRKFVINPNTIRAVPITHLYGDHFGSPHHRQPARALQTQPGHRIGNRRANRPMPSLMIIDS